MKKVLLTTAILLLTLTLLVGCSTKQAEVPITTEPSPAVTEPTQAPVVETPPAESTSVETAPPVETTAPTESISNALANSPYAVYAEQVDRYYKAIVNQCDESFYFKQAMSPMPIYYYDGNELSNIGFAMADLDGDGIQELLIGAIKDHQTEPVVFEIWTLMNNQPVMLAQSGYRTRYYLQFAEDDGIWNLAYEADNGATNYGVYYLQITDSTLEVIQGVIYDANANAKAPWFMAYDLDWDVTNDMAIDEDTAKAIMDAGRRTYTTVEYIPFSQFN